MERTKYFLHGGATGRETERNKEFFREVVDSIDGDKACILLVYFARERNLWPVLFEEDKRKFQHAGAKTDATKIEVSSQEKDKLTEQLRSANIIFIRGGDTEILHKKMSEIKNLEDLLKGKVIAGSSAGAYIFCTYYYSNNENVVKKGLGILPIKLYAHYDDDQVDNFKRLEETGPDLPSLKVREADFLVQYK